MNRVWWKEAVAYEIYPRSFKDSNGDGIGDLQGIIEKLDYVKELGIDLIWICPMYKSPNDDNGYDISDYQDIMNEFGTMEDFDFLLKETHKRGMRLIIDLVVNHTSDEHPWFIESCASKDNDKRDWYIWRDGKCKSEPNNWESIFGGSAWEYDKNTKQYFLHIFSKKQPDLNWENENMRKAVYNMINWWLDKGIDGFRIDAISHIKKEDGLKDMPNPKKLKYVPSFDKHRNVKGIHKYLEEIKENTFDKYDDIMTVGEAGGVTVEEAPLWVSEELGKFNMIFQFEHADLWSTEVNETPDIKGFKRTLSKWQKGLENKGWNALFVENHDLPRVVSTWGNDTEYWRESATAFAVMYFMMQGTPFIYQGQEIGMTNVKFEKIEDYSCVGTKNMYLEKREQGMSHHKIMEIIWKTSRDNSRTPMQWNASFNAGFSTEKPWIKINSNYVEINVEKQQKDPNSILNFYKKMISIKKEDIFVYGMYDLILEDHDQIYAYTRTLNEEKAVIICNLTKEEAVYKYKNIELTYDKLLLSNYNVDYHDKIISFALKPYETRVYRIGK